MSNANTVIENRKDATSTFIWTGFEGMKIKPEQWIAWIAVFATAAVTMVTFAFATFETSKHATESKDEVSRRLSRIEDKLDQIIIMKNK